MTKTAQLKVEVTRARQTLEERDFRIRALEEQSARAATAAATPTENPLAVVNGAELQLLVQLLREKQACIDLLEGNYSRIHRDLLCSSTQAAKDDENRERLAKIRRKLEAANEKMWRGPTRCGWLAPSGLTHRGCHRLAGGGDLLLQLPITRPI